MPARRTALRAIGIASALAGLSAGPRGDGPLPGSDLTTRRAIGRAEAIAIGRGFRQLMGGGIGNRSACLAEIDVEDGLKGDLPRGRLTFGVAARRPEAFPP